MKSIILVASAVFLFMCSLTMNQAAAADLKVGIISIQKIIDGSKAGQEARKVLEAKRSELQPKFEAEQKSLKEQATEIEKKSSVWSEEVRGQKEREYQKKMREYQLKVEDAQYEMKQLEKNVLDPIFKELQIVITDLGKEQGLSMIFEKAKSGGLLYADDSLDISDAVIKALDAKETK